MSADGQGYVLIDPERCTGCNLCVVLCPVDCLALGATTNSMGYRVAVLAREDACTGCEVCGHTCPHLAIEVFRRVRPAAATARSMIG